MKTLQTKPKLGKTDEYVLRVLEKRHRIHVVENSREHNSCLKLNRTVIGEPMRGMITFE